MTWASHEDCNTRLLDGRYTVRIKQHESGGWTVQSYHRALKHAKRQARALAPHWVCAVFDGYRKLWEIGTSE